MSDDGLVIAQLTGTATCNHTTVPATGVSSEQGTAYYFQVGDVRYSGVVGCAASLEPRCWACGSTFKVDLGEIHEVVVHPPRG